MNSANEEKEKGILISSFSEKRMGVVQLREVNSPTSAQH